jgi:creatinine amidohydrolase
MLLQHAAWPEVAAYLQRSTGILMPIGSTEQHGPNGLIGTDAICAEVLAKGIGLAAEAFVGPTIGVGMAVHHMEFSGSMTLRPSTLIRVIQDYVLSLARHGFRRFFFLNGHGGNVATVQAAFYEIYAAAEGVFGAPAAGGELRCKLVNWWEAPAAAQLSKTLFGPEEGSHATPSEVALTQYAYPETVKSAALDPPRAPASRFFGPADYRRRFADGRIGSNPGLASPEKGREIYEAAVPDLTRLYKEFLAAE